MTKKKSGISELQDNHHVLISYCYTRYQINDNGEHKCDAMTIQEATRQRMMGVIMLLLFQIQTPEVSNQGTNFNEGNAVKEKLFIFACSFPSFSYLCLLSMDGRYTACSMHLQYHHFQNATGSPHRDRNVEKNHTTLIQQHFHLQINGMAI